MSNDPLDSFLVPNKQTPDLDSMPSMWASSATPIDARREPKLSAKTADTPQASGEKPVKAERPEAVKVKPTAAVPHNTVKAKARTLKVPATKKSPEEPPAEKTKNELKKTIHAAKQTARQAEQRDRYRKSRGSRFALYLVFIVAVGFILAIASNSMIQSMEELRDTQVSSAASNATAN